MFTLKIIFLTLCCVTLQSPDYKTLEEMTLFDILYGEISGIAKTITGQDKEALDLITNAILQHNQNIDNSTETGKKCFSCIPGYQVLARYFIEPTYDLVKAWVGCADVILDVPKFKHEKCHTSWAGVMISIIKDRICRLAGGPVKVKLTPQDIMDCCPNCKYKGQDLCEHGGDPLAAWKFWIRFGVDFGGKLLKKASPICVNETQAIDKCKHIKCLIEVEGSVNKLKPRDTIGIGQTAFLLPNNMTHIQVEIFRHGPVQCSIQVFKDLFEYKKGQLYKHKEGEFKGYHYVKLIGWGIDKATNSPYWKVLNPSWGPRHGDKGVINFLRGENHCEIESNCIGSVYKKSAKMTDDKKKDGDKKKDRDKKKDGDKKKTKSSVNFTTANYSLFFILLITHILVGDIRYY